VTSFLGKFYARRIGKLRHFILINIYKYLR